MKTTLIYIHGLGSDKTSRKYIELQNFFKDAFNYYCLEWKTTDQVTGMIQSLHADFLKQEKLIVVGDSTGANFAYQFREMRKASGLQSLLIVTSPLLNMDYRIASFDFPEQLKSHLIKVTSPEDLLIIAGTKDEIIDQSPWMKKIFMNVLVVPTEDTHRLPKFDSCLPAIKRYLQNKKYL